MKRMLMLFVFLLSFFSCLAWGFFAHQKINGYAVFLLPPEMLVLYKPGIVFLTEHATDPDKRRYAVKEEGARHYLDIDHYGVFPFDSLPRKWEDAVARFTQDSLEQHGIVPWWIQIMHRRLVAAFREKDRNRILKLSAEIGHYLADAHVPLHASSNHNGQLTGQRGIHGFWESRIPELLADTEWDFFIGKAEYIGNAADFIWKRILESAAASDTVLRYERLLSARLPSDQKYSFEDRNGTMLKQYSSAFSKAYDAMLGGMVERRMRMSVHAVACFWYTAWVDAGQPDLSQLADQLFTAEEQAVFEALNRAWRTGAIKGREED